MNKVLIAILDLLIMWLLYTSISDKVVASLVLFVPICIAFYFLQELKDYVVKIKWGTIKPRLYRIKRQVLNEELYS